MNNGRRPSRNTGNSQRRRPNAYNEYNDVPRYNIRNMNAGKVNSYMQNNSVRGNDYYTPQKNPVRSNAGQNQRSNRSNYGGNGFNSLPPENHEKRRFPWGALIITLIAITVIFLAIWVIAGRSFNVGPFVPSKSETEATGSNSAAVPVLSTSGGGETDTPKSDDGAVTYTEMTLLSAGDVMYHTPQLDSAYNSATGEYDFTNTYKYVKDIVSSADYAVVNFESTLAGADYGYSGYPVFNSPDSGFTALLDCGFDMMLFANNHCYDMGMAGVTRTQQVFEENGAHWIGARESTSDKTYTNVTVNGINIGMLNSTDDISYGNTSPRTINGISLTNEALGLLDIYNLSLLDEFYSRVEAEIADLKSNGADIIVYYIHWGSEYYLEHNAAQEEVAQKLCDLGVDVIIGSHPHVVEDTDILTASDGSGRNTLVFYSMGNYVSNQNRLTMGDTMNSTYTENGLMVELRIRKYSTGECMVTDVDTIPTWVHRYSSGGVMQYEIVPLDAAISSPADYGLYNSDFGMTHAQSALIMTNDILGNIKEVFAETVSLPVTE